MADIFHFLTAYGAALGVIGAAVVFSWSVVQFFVVRGRESRNREFETFHRLIRELVEPPSEGAGLYIDRQAAILYELRFFRRYYPFTGRTLRALRRKWTEAGAFPRLLEEMDLTLSFIDDRSTGFARRLWKRACPSQKV